MPFYPMSRRTKTCFSFRFLEKRTDFYGKACRAPVRKLFLCPAGGIFECRNPAEKNTPGSMLSLTQPILSISAATRNLFRAEMPQDTISFCSAALEGPKPAKEPSGNFIRHSTAEAGRPCLRSIRKARRLFIPQTGFLHPRLRRRHNPHHQSQSRKAGKNPSNNRLGQRIALDFHP